MNLAPKASVGELSFVSPQFKKEAVKAIMAITGFIIVYLLLFVLSLGLVALSFYGGIAIIGLKPSLYTLIAGGGLVACGIMVFVFLVKFLFAASQPNETDSIEITYEDEPKLFEVIYALAEETGTPRPQKVLLSADVNACVFYNSSFWSLFIPIKKNLKIGLGLVNAVNVSELKAIIAHEFGHFSQRSMKLGSWVYQVNKIIYDMLYNNRGYASTIDSIANVHGIFSFFAQVTVKVVQAIQWILRQMFMVVNKAYLGLSRQMEFHADLVAASVCGSNNIINSLKRLDFANTCFNTTLDFCNRAWEEKKTVEDFYTGYTLMMKHIAELNHFSFVDGLPVLQEYDQTVVNRINYKDQWASHPTLNEREAFLENYNLTAGVEEISAWSVFSTPKKWKSLLTKHFYKAIPQDDVKAVLTGEEFEELVVRRFKQFSFPAVYKEYYSDRQIEIFDPNEVVAEPFSKQSFHEVLTEENMLLPRKITCLAQDIALLRAIQQKEIHVRSFDLDGQKHSSNEAAVILAELETELVQQQKELAGLDKKLFRYFYAIAPLAEADNLKNLYHAYFNDRKEADRYLETVNEMMQALSPLYRGDNLTLETVKEIISNLKQVSEPVFKKMLQHWSEKTAFDGQAVFKARVGKFIASDYQYFSGTAFFENEMEELNRIVQEAWNTITDYLFLQFRHMAEVQAALLETKEGLKV